MDQAHATGWRRVGALSSAAGRRALEAYEVDIISGGDVVRTIETSTPEASYSATQRQADLGSATAGYEVAIYQISQTIGRGDALKVGWG